MKSSNAWWSMKFHERNPQMQVTWFCTVFRVERLCLIFLCQGRIGILKVWGACWMMSMMSDTLSLWDFSKVMSSCLAFLMLGFAKLGHAKTKRSWVRRGRICQGSWPEQAELEAKIEFLTKLRRLGSFLINDMLVCVLSISTCPENLWRLFCLWMFDELENLPGPGSRDVQKQKHCFWGKTLV